MNDFNPGDLVVCISTDSPCCDHTVGEGNGKPQPELHMIYKVALVGIAQCLRCGEVLVCFVPAGMVQDWWAWPQVCFRKVENHKKPVTIKQEEYT